MKAKKPRARSMQLPTGLSKKEAYRAASKRARSDFRGLSYNAKTGRAVIV